MIWARFFAIMLVGLTMLYSQEQSPCVRVWDGLYSQQPLSVGASQMLGDNFDEASYLALGRSVWKALLAESYNGDHKKASRDFADLTANKIIDVKGYSDLFLGVCRAFRHTESVMKGSEVPALFPPMKDFIDLFFHDGDKKVWSKFSEDLDSMPIEYAAIVIGLVPSSYGEIAEVYAEKKLKGKVDGEAVLSLRESLRLLREQRSK